MRRRTRDWQLDVPSRPWTRAERKVVLRGFLGRLSVAVEPLVVAAFFSVLPIALILRKQETAMLVAPIFGAAALAFFAYALILMVPSTRALIGTRSPIYVVDGYVSYRTRLEHDAPVYSVAVLDAGKQLLGEWPLRSWPPAIRDREMWPALVEFSEFGGIHRIDGRSTGVLPSEIPALGIGVAQHAAVHRDTEG